MEISVKRIHYFLDEFDSLNESPKIIRKLTLPTCDIITEDGTKTCCIINMNINKIIELTEKSFSVDEIYHVNYKDKEQLYIMSKIILDKNRFPLLYIKKTSETCEINGRNTTQTYSHYYVSSEVMLNTKSWICFVIRKYIMYYILDGYYPRRKVHVINGRDISALVKCRINKFTSKNIAKLKIINGE